MIILGKRLNGQQAERKIRALNFKPLRRYGLKFFWASGRIYQDKIAVSFWLDHHQYQIISSLAWDKKDVEDAVTAIAEMFLISPQEWSDVRYLPQKKGLQAPDIAGKGWRKDE